MCRFVNLRKTCYVGGMSQLSRLLLGCVFALFVFVRPAAAPPSAELVHFSSGRVMSVVDHRVEGDTIVLSLKGGGEVACDASLIAWIELDPGPGPPLAQNPEPVPKRPVPARPYAELVQNASARHGVDPMLLHAMIEVESGYRSDATSPSGAMGLMQLMPATAAQYAVHDPFDPGANIDAGARHMRVLLDRFGVEGALAAYNAGEGSVRKFRGIPPYPKSHSYVTRILRIVSDYNDE